MEAEQVVEKILADAKAQADEIKNEAQEKEKVQQAELDEQLTQYKQETEKLAQKEAEAKKSHLLAAARMQITKGYLAEKRKIVDEVFEKAKQQIKTLPDDEYRDVMSRLIENAVETGQEEVMVDRNESRIDDNLIKGVNEKLSSSKKGNIRLSDQWEDLQAGFILKRGKIKSNASLAVLLKQARDALEINLAKELFVNEG
ncbi:MAG: V-type ATP synthase subunit E [Planctomycetota bacterium]|jgi:V/A-type H+-transporting ATPase subunit E